jgi:aminopeptidase N
MDIARTPSTPDGNPEMADAAHEMTTPVEIRRADYRPFGWLVPQVALVLALGVDSMTVIAT